MKVHGIDLVEAECLYCGDQVWHWHKLLKPSGQPANLDLTQDGADVLISIHECDYEPENGGQAEPGTGRVNPKKSRSIHVSNDRRNDRNQ